MKNIKRLSPIEPLEYIRGFTDFLGCKIDLSKRPLIPRKETEFWVEKAIQIISKDGVKNTLSRDFYTNPNLEIAKMKVLDVFAGSGCIGLAVLSKLRLPAGRQAAVVFADKDKNCIKQIKINLKLNNYHRTLRGIASGSNRANMIIQSDVFSNIKGRFDFIFANPPYVAIKNKNLVQKSVLEYEPHAALFGGQDGLFYIRKFLRGAKKYLADRGRIFMEFSPEQKGEIEKILKKYNYKNFSFHKDQYGKWRWAMVG